MFLTGAAVTRVFAAAERLGVPTRWRGPGEGRGRGARTEADRRAGAARRRGLAQRREPFTTADVVDALETIPVDGREATVVHYGERNEPLVAYLAARGARVHELTVYEWRLPADVGPLSRAIDAIIAGDIDVLAFTSQIQVRHLLEVAGPARRDALVRALNERVLVGAVGPTCAAACDAAGVRGVVTPDPPEARPDCSTALAPRYSARRTDVPDRNEGTPVHIDPDEPRRPPADADRLLSALRSQLHAVGAHRRARHLHRRGPAAVGEPAWRAGGAADPQRLAAADSARLLSDRCGARRVGASMLAFLFLPLAIGWLSAASWPAMMAIGLMLGTAGASFAVALPLASSWYPPQRQGLVMGIAAAGNSGTVITNLLAPRLAASVGWQDVFGLAMLPLAPCWRLPADRARGSRRASRAGRRWQVLTQADLWWFCLFYSVTFGGYVGLSSFLPLFLRDQQGLAPGAAGL